ncbi:hypothetical protein K461DRAFT_48828 [Myriangium duriaei CBS 260.36]|uniref:Uncharacterized protein n=1 Tax=Myriangium duriaei CBS 260.36 TaxID=1168546 RepID=A0A9P4MH28_9PEZI|nr:hypothetical protein K461DRAFT_48828 [Myriangium duriaei CBS 260.36]
MLPMTHRRCAHKVCSYRSRSLALLHRSFSRLKACRSSFFTLWLMAGCLSGFVARNWFPLLVGLPSDRVYLHACHRQPCHCWRPSCPQSHPRRPTGPGNMHVDLILSPFMIMPIRLYTLCATHTLVRLDHA